MSGIVDCEMRIGDEVFVHGYIDEIRNDMIIIRNAGGYFGTSRDEVFCYETENPCDGCVCDDGKHLMYCMNCKGIVWKTEPPKVINTPQTDCDTCAESGSYKCTKCDGEMYYKADTL